MVTTSQAERTAPSAGPEQIAVRNPVTSETIGHVKQSSADDICEAVARARVAQRAWAERSLKERAAIARRWGDLIWKDQEKIVEVIRRETGKTRRTALAEVLATDTVAQYYASNAPKILSPKRRKATFPVVQRAKLIYKPHGVVGFITPWNFPFNLAFMDMLPALVAGNAVILKPSEITPYSAEYGAELWRQVGLPEDLLQIVHGDGRAGAELVEHVDYISFTGSTATGRKVATRAAQRLIPYSMELGGKDPMIVLKDADLDMAATSMIRGAFENAGQFCMSVERVYVEEGAYDALLDRVEHYIQQYRIGNTDGDDLYMGSLTNQRELERTEAHVADAVNKGAKVVYGGKRRPDLGPLFYEPTVLVDVDHNMELMREETFGPLLPIMKVNDAEEALHLANDSEYGLAASVFGKDMSRAEQIAIRIDSGDVCVNATQFVVATPSLPSGGQRNSGVGRRNGPEGILRFVTTQSVVLDSGLGQKPELTLLTDQNLKLVNIMRRVRRVLPFI